MSLSTKIELALLPIILLIMKQAAIATPPPSPLPPVPSDRQLNWSQLDAYAFVHFSINTFTDEEWGYGDESPSAFNPTDFDANQIVASVKAGGLKGVILTCKHHDGFCLWPTQFTDHCIKNSPYKNGHGDIVREISDACHHQGMKFGIYLSPWDRNSGVYGQSQYITYYRNQMRELLTAYGPIFEVWLDGANGGDGYYGGAREKRLIDRSTYYDWPGTIKIIREIQPDACIFSDAGPDVRWVGNEKGIAGETCWQTLNTAGRYPGHADAKALNLGDRPGTDWIPAEADVSIRPGWFYHATQDDKVKTPLELTSLYLQSVGRGANLILNLPPDRRGRIPDTDAKSLVDWHHILEGMYAKDSSAGAIASTTHTRGDDPAFEPANLLDQTGTKYWAPADSDLTPEIELALPKPETFNIIQLREYLPLGQRIDQFAIDSWVEGHWLQVTSGTSIGNRRLLQLKQPVTTDRVRLRILKAASCPAMWGFGLFTLKT